MLIFCAIATPCPRAPTSCNPFVRRFNVACTPTQPHSCWASHNLQSGMTGTGSGTRATPTAHSSHNVRCASTSCANAIAARAHRATGPQRPFCQHWCQHVATATCLARHAAPHLAAPCCSGAACPLLRFEQDAAKSQCSPGPPGRLRLCCRCVCVCVCVLGGVMLQCRSMCLLFSGRLSFAVRLRQLSVGLAVALRSFSYATHTLSHTHRSHVHATRNSHAVHPTHTALTTLLPHPA